MINMFEKPGDEKTITNRIFHLIIESTKKKSNGNDGTEK